MKRVLTSSALLLAAVLLVWLRAGEGTPARSDQPVETASPALEAAGEGMRIPPPEALPPASGELPEVDFSRAAEEEGIEYFRRSEDGSIQLEPIDLLYATEEPVLRGEFDGQRVELTGELRPRPATPSVSDLVVMHIFCCAADARPVSIEVRGAEGVASPTNGWVRVRGVAVFEERGGELLPFVRAEEFQSLAGPPEKLPP